MGKRELSEEAKTAIKLGKLVADSSLDLEGVGVELARIRPSIYYNRLIIVAESAVEEQEKMYGRHNYNSFF
jgi:hypothetical protein